MTQFDNNYKTNKAIFETNFNETQDFLKTIIESNYRDNYLENLLTFLSDEEIRLFIENSLENFIYKKVFNMALNINKNYNFDKNDIEEYKKAKEEFKISLKEKFSFNLADENIFENLAKNFLKLTSSPEKARNENFTKYLKKFADENKINKCYLCGKIVKFDNKEESINLSHFDEKDFKVEKKEDKKSLDYYKEYYIEVKELRKQITSNFDYKNIFNSKDMRTINKIIDNPIFNQLDEIFNKKEIKFPIYEKQIDKIISLLNEKQINKIENLLRKKDKEFIDNHLKKINLTRLKSIYSKIYYLKNNAVCEIEHNFPAKWGGDLSNQNMFISCHDCNNKKGHIAFYTDVDYSNVFSNSNKIENVSKDIKSEIKIALKIKQKFKCKSSDCDNNLLSGEKFYLLSENGLSELDFFSLSIYCEKCVERNFAKIRKLDLNEFIENNCIKI
ncbi:MAG: hypothetical protein PHQ70_05980 [Arcobacter sp.]|uniref:hypothetical protein n=1 Tax=Arcobacter sp. TaxID=1872629 RepID=UPI002589B5A0|nr:hypothetical protein [Arcobacter sp.]MDD3008401.1 hypothetical protein [Arcobacter sp.]